MAAIILPSLSADVAVCGAVTIQNAKKHLRMDDCCDDDTYIQALIIAATQYAENFCNQTFVQREIRQGFSQFYSRMALLNGPVSEVLSVSYLSDGVREDLLAWRLSTIGNALYPNECPRTDCADDAVIVTCVAGYGAVPEQVQQAILLLVGHFYENRESVIVGQPVANVPMATDHLLQAYRNYR